MRFANFLNKTGGRWCDRNLGILYWRGVMRGNGGRENIVFVQMLGDLRAII